MPLATRHARASSALCLLALAFASAALAQMPQPGTMMGRVLDARGVPLSGVQVIADNTQFYNTNAIAVSGADGRYVIDTMHPVGTWIGSAQVTRSYNGKRFVLDLDPDTVDAFAGNVGAVRNFTWKLSGERRDGLGTYGMSVIYYFDGFEDRKRAVTSPVVTSASVFFSSLFNVQWSGDVDEARGVGCTHRGVGA